VSFSVIKAMSHPEIIDEEFSGQKPRSFYGKSSVLWYSLIFTPVVGALLMFINAVQSRKILEGGIVLSGSLLYSAANMYLYFSLNLRHSAWIVFILLNLAGGNLLASPLWKWLFGGMKYIHRNGWKLLPVILFVHLLITMLLWYSGTSLVAQD
jgi:hypothetical protein